MNPRIKFIVHDYQDIETEDIATITAPDSLSEESSEFIQLIKGNQKNAKQLLEKFIDSLNTLFEDGSLDIKCLQQDNDPTVLSKLYDNKNKRFQGTVGVVSHTLIQTYEINDENILDLDKDTKEISLDITLQIHSRMDTRETPYFLSTLLFHERLNLNNKTVPTKEEDIFDYLLLFWFKQHLQTIFLKGFFRTYRRFERNDDKFRGSIDIARHIRLNMGQRNGRIAYSYRENTIDNYFNYLILAAYDYLKFKYSDLVIDNFDNDIELKNVITQLKTSTHYDAYTTRQIIEKNLKPISHPYYLEYEELRKICLKILRDEGISFFGEEHELQTPGFLIYLPTLWEKYLEGKINTCLKGDELSNISCVPQKNIKIFGMETNNNSYEFKQKIRPDFVLNHFEHPFMILDAKFRPGWFDVISDNSKKLDVLSDDYYKCIRDMNSINGCSSGVIFPSEVPESSLQKKDSQKIKKLLVHRISEFNKKDLFYTIPVYVPPTTRGQEYSQWKQEFEQEQEPVWNCLRKIIIYEKNYFSEIFNLLKKHERNI